MGVGAPPVSSSDITKGNIIFTWGVNNQDWYKAVVGAWGLVAHATYWLGNYLKSTNDNVDDKVALMPFHAPTTQEYTLYMIAQTGAWSGKAHILVDGADVAEIDCYTAGDVANALLNVSIGTVAKGVHTLAIAVSDKNAASADYNMAFQAVSIGTTE